MGNARNNHGRRRRRFQVIDPESLAALIRGEIARQFGGNLSAAVRDVNARSVTKSRLGKPGRTLYRALSQPQLHRLATGNVGEIHLHTLMWLQYLLPRRRHRELQDTLLSPLAKAELDRYYSWVRKWRFHVGRGNRWPPISDRELEDQRARAEERARIAGDLLADWRARFPADMKQLDDALKRYAHPAARGAVSRFRLVETFVEQAEEIAIERGWDELGATEQAQFVKASIKREIILLRRSPDLQRAQQIKPQDTLCEAEAIKRWAGPGWSSV
jgi:hypothetical protein